MIRSSRKQGYRSIVILALIALSLRTGCAFFSPSTKSAAPRIGPTTSGTLSSLGSVENWISGVTNSPPSKPLLSAELETSLVAGTSLQDKELKCVYKGSKDGWSAIDFHQCADEKGSALVVGLTRSGQLFGGFNPLGWRSTDDYYQSNAAFLWFAKGNQATRCPILSGGELKTW